VHPPLTGYSGTPLANKLGIKPGARVLLVDAPDYMAEWLAPLPQAVELCGAGGTGFDVIFYFTAEAKALMARFGALAEALEPDLVRPAVRLSAKGLQARGEFARLSNDLSVTTNRNGGAL